MLFVITETVPVAQIKEGLTFIVALTRRVQYLVEQQVQGGSLQEGIFNKGALKNRVIFNIRGASVSLGIKASQSSRGHPTAISGKYLLERRFEISEHLL